MALNLEDYFKTTFEDKLLVKMPEREDDHLTPATRLLEKRREMQEVEQALAAQKEEFQMKMESLQQRREELERKEYSLKEHLLKFDHFLKENDAKRTRAMKKATEEKDLKRVKESEITKLRGESDTFVAAREKVKGRLDRLVVYQKYLEKVIENAEEFHEIREILSRHDTLTSTHQDLMERDHQNQERIEAEKSKLAKYTEDKNNEILGYNNQLSGLQTRFDKAQSSAAHWESKWTHIKNTAASKTLELGKIKMATHNLYLLVMNRQRGGVRETVDETSEQLDKIQVFIQDLNKITDEIKRSDVTATSMAATSSH